MCRGRPALLVLPLLVLLPASVFAQPTQDLKKIQEGLKAAMVGRVVTLRGFYRGSLLRFDSTGKLVDGGKPGPWTLYAKVQVTDVRVKEEKVQIEGRRIFLLYDEKEGWQQLDSREGVSIETAYRPSAHTEDEIRASLRNVLLAPGETMAEITPPYWRRFLRGEVHGGRLLPALPPEDEGDERPEGEGEAKPSAAEAETIKVSSGVQEARLIKKVEPQYPQMAKQGRIQGEVHLEGVIGKDGKIKRLDIVRPRGMGLDEAVVDAVSQWEYSPTLLMGKPAAVQTLIIVRFKMF